MAKHLPPSAATLQLVDVDGAAGTALAELRGDLQLIPVKQGETWGLPPNSVDAVIAYGDALDAIGLQMALDVLRPGGRLIMTDPNGEVHETHVQTLESAGYTRILVGIGTACPAPVGVLVRGEKPHTTDDTLLRVQGVADKDTASDLQMYKGRYVHLLVQQTPNKPVWALKPDEQVTWHALALNGAHPPTLLAFSSLPRAVAFMQPAVLAGQIKDVNKVAKFSREMALAWTLPVLLNPQVGTLNGHSVTLIPIDPSAAEASDE
jgi:hypothetical protein